MSRGMMHDNKAQSAVWGLLTILILLAIAGGLVDIYRLYTARNWAYAVAQEAALSGASRGRDWSKATSAGSVSLVSATAQSTAEGVVKTEMTTRGIQGYSLDVRVLPDLQHPLPQGGAHRRGDRGRPPDSPAPASRPSRPARL